MENVFTWKWLRAALVRALKTVAQTAAATIGTAVMISEVDWRMVVSAALLAGALSLLTSVAGLPEAQEKYRPRARGTGAGGTAARTTQCLRPPHRPPRQRHKRGRQGARFPNDPTGSVRRHGCSR